MFVKLQKGLGQIQREYIRSLKQVIKSEGKYGTGFVYRSIKKGKLSLKNFILSAPIIAEEGLVWMDRGRGPGKAPPVGVMDGWIKRVLRVRDPKKVRGIAYVIGQKIAKRGVPASNVLDKAQKKIDSKLLRLINDGVEDEIEDQIADSFKK